MSEVHPAAGAGPRIGVVLGGTGGSGDTWPRLAEQYRRAVDAGVASVWLTQHLGFDALTAFTAWGAGAPTGPELGTAVIPIPPRHPLVLAQQALTAQAATAGRIALGLGLGHRATLDAVYGVDTPRSVSFLRDYLDVLEPMLGGGHAKPSKTFSVDTAFLCEPPAPPPVLLAALGPRMLELAGARTAGTITWMTGPATLAAHTVPTITRAAAEHGRPAPRVVACLPVCVTDDVAEARAHFVSAYPHYARIPSYAAMLAREGVEHPGDIALVGDESTVAAAIDALADTGVTDVAAMVESVRAKDLDRTWRLLGQLSTRGRR